MKTKLNGKKGGILSRNINCVAASVIAAIIMIFAYIVWEFFPFGENIILRMDLYHQYAPLFAELYERIFGGDSLLYSFTSGLGSCFLGNYFNYLSSPTMLFVMIFGHYNIPEAIAAIVLFKAAASAYTFTYFLGKISKKSDLSTAAFGLLYAFCGYFIAYYWNIMWLDAVVVFPLVMLGIWYIIEEGKSLPYVLSLAYVMMTNYYMAYMTCLLSVIFFLYFYFSKHSLSSKMNKDIILKDKYKKTLGAKMFNSAFVVRGVNFAASSILAALIAAFALLPVVFILQNSSATNSSFPTSFSSYFTIFDFFANHLAGVEPTIRSSGDAVYPNIYCGIITLVLVPLFMFCKKISVREKISTGAVAAVFFMSFNINILNYIWHGFHYPNDLPYRFSFAYSFFLLYVAYRAFTNLDRISSREILMSAALVSGFAVIVEKVGSANVDLKVVWTSVIFAVVYAVVLVFIKNPKYVKSSMSILLLTCVCAEILIADTPNYKVTQTKTSYTSSYEDTEAAIDIIEELEGEDTFYRMELATLLTRMDNSWFYYPGVSTFTSMAYEDVAHLQDYLGLYGNKINSYTYNCQTPLYNSMMSIKYIVDNSGYVATDNYKPPLDGDFLYTEVGSYNDMTVYENNYWLPVGFSVDDDTDLMWIYDDSNPFVVQNDFLFNASGVSDILTPLSGVVSNLNNIDEVDEFNVNSGVFSVYKSNSGQSSNEITFTYDITETQNVYVYFECSDVSSILVSADDFLYNQSIDNKPYVLNVGTVEAGTSVTVSYSLKDDSISGSVRQYVYGLDQSKFENAYNTILDNGVLDVTVNNESYIKGTVDLADGKMLYTSIPYDTAWTVYVDGVKVEDENIVKIGNALMGIKMDSGEHTVEFRYTPSGLILGLCLTVAGILLLVLLVVFRKKKILMFSDGFRRDVLELGRWRDTAKESEIAFEKEQEEALIGQMIEDSQTDGLLSEEPDSSWEAALAEAENYARSSALSEPDPSVITEDITDSEIDGVDENDVEDEISEDESEAESSEDGLDAQPEKSLDEVLDEFERATEEIDKKKLNKISAEDKKSAQKKRINLTIFIVIFVLAVAASIGVMIYAAVNSEDPTTTTDPASVVESSETDSVSEEETSSELTTIATTAATTESTTASTTVSTTESTTASTTAARSTEAYTGAYEVYTVKSGDNLYSILRSFGIRDSHENVRKMCDFNGISPSAGLYVGQTIKVPMEY